MNNLENSEMSSGLVPEPIEDKQYLNYYQYLRERLIESFGEEMVIKYENTPIVEMGLSMLNGEQLTDGMIMRTMNHTNIELVKDILIRDTIADGKLSDNSVIDYYAVLKNDPSDNVPQEEAIKYAEEMVADFYYFLFNELMGGKNG